MSKFTVKVKSLFSRRRPIAVEDAAEIADWVGEGGALHPDGPPQIVDQAVVDQAKDKNG